MSPEEKIRSYIPLVDFIAEIAYPNSEVVLHDVRNQEHSLIVIRNGQISGREIGAPMTDFAARLLNQALREGKDFLTNYIGKAGSPGKFFKSSTYFIRDDDNEEIIGMLGINTDISVFSEMHRILAQILAVEDVLSDSQENTDSGEKNFSVQQMVGSVMDQVLNTYVVDASHMTGEEKKEVVDRLNEKGVFLIKGAVAWVAQSLEVSEQTIYRYLK